MTSPPRAVYHLLRNFPPSYPLEKLSTMRCEPMFEVMMMMVLRKSTVRPFVVESDGRRPVPATRC